MAKGTRDNCPICLEYMFDSRKPMVLLRCGHPLHHHCLMEVCSACLARI